MRFGVNMFATDLSIGIVELARAAEDRGFDSLWVPEHTHIPTSRSTPPPTGDAALADEYRRSLDPFVALTAAATATTTLRVGTGIALVAQREPIVTAKAAASLAHLSGGRLVLGIGFGWNEDEMTNHGVDYRRRRDRTREHVMAMQRLWAEDEAAFDGEFVRFTPSWSWPKPPDRSIPIVIGGSAGATLFSHIAEYGNGWIPIGGAGLADNLPRLRDTVAAAGRDPEALEIIPIGSLPDHGKLDHYERIGVTECVFYQPSADSDTVLPILDRYAKLVAERRS